MKFYNNPVMGYNPFKSIVLVDEAFLNTRWFSLHPASMHVWTDGEMFVVPNQPGYMFFRDWWVNYECSNGTCMIDNPTNKIHHMYINRFLK